MTISGIVEFIIAVFRLIIGACPLCGGEIGETDTLALEMEYCEVCDCGTRTTRREVWRRYRLARRKEAHANSEETP